MPSPSGSWIVNRFKHFHTSHAEIKPLTAAVVVGSIVACLFPVYSYCQNMRVGYFKKGGINTAPEMEKLRNDLADTANKKD